MSESNQPLKGDKVKRHLAVLAKDVFEIESRWPHFRLLLNEVEELSRHYGPSSNIAILERTLLYGNCSLLAPLFAHCNVASFDCSPVGSEERGAYNEGMTLDPNFTRIPSKCRAQPDAIPVQSGAYDLVVVPNLVHHVALQAEFFQEMARIVRPGGHVHIFEPTIREIHQAPLDYVRYTPYGVSAIAESVGLETVSVVEEGGAFTAVAYCCEQALQYLPEEDRMEKEAWYRRSVFPELQKLEGRYGSNLVRPNSRFPVAFAVLLKRVE
ncbi:methyltransferase domain-containing protein [bacterium]|nr:methyltransferase domain-containing protein [bacterium]